MEKTTYELFKERRPNISYFQQFGCTCYILNNKHYLKKFDAKAQRGIFSKTLCVEESMHVKFDDKEPGNEIQEQDESIADIQVTEDTPEPDQTIESEDSPEAEPTPNAKNEEASDEAQDGSHQASQYKKYLQVQVFTSRGFNHWKQR